MASPTEGVGTEGATRAARRRWPFWAPAVAVLVVGLIVTGVLTWLSAGQYTRNEQRLLKLRARDVGMVLTEALPSIQTPLASATALANATDGNLTKFKQFVAPYVGTRQGQPFVSMSLWRLDSVSKGPVAVVGVPLRLSASRPRTAPFFGRAASSSTLNVIGLLRHAPLRLGYTYTGMASGPFAAYAEGALPANRYSPVQKNSSFNDINYALHLGSTRPEDLLVATQHHLPLSGRRITIKVPFGNTSFVITVAARGSLGGALPQELPWIIAIVGVLLTLGAAALTLRLIERRRQSERLAEENRRLFAQERNIAQTLQHALLPERLPQLPGLQLSARYQAGAEGVDIGGDWYDLIELESDRLLLIVGDVSGRGLKAATTMASLRFAIRAYALQGDSPEAILSKLSGLINVSVDGQLATVLSVLVDSGARKLSVTSAGHLPPLMLSTQGSSFVEPPVGIPVGVDRRASYSSTTVRVPPGATLLAFTDGLVERRGETIDVGLERLRSRASQNHVPLEQLLANVLEDRRDDAPDDTAIAGIRWMT